MRYRTIFIRDGAWTAPYGANQLTLPPEWLATLAAVLESFSQILHTAGFSIGLRLVQEVLDFAENTYRHGPHDASLPWLLDRQLLQKILPRLHGTRSRLEPLLARLLLLCWPARDQPKFRQQILELPLDPQMIELHRTSALYSHTELPPPDLPASANKIAHMMTELQLEPYIDFHLYR